MGLLQNRASICGRMLVISLILLEKGYNRDFQHGNGYGVNPIDLIGCQYDLIVVFLGQGLLNLF